MAKKSGLCAQREMARGCYRGDGVRVLQALVHAREHGVWCYSRMVSTVWCYRPWCMRAGGVQLLAVGVRMRTKHMNSSESSHGAASASRSDSDAHVRRALLSFLGCRQCVVLSLPSSSLLGLVRGLSSLASQLHRGKIRFYRSLLSRS